MSVNAPSEPLFAKLWLWNSGPAVAMKTVRTKLTAPRIVFRGKQFKPALFFRREFFLAAQDAVKFRIE